MSDHTGIQWTDSTWNPVTGCTKVSQGCKNCYAERVFPRAYARYEVPAGGGDLSGPYMRARRFTDVQCHPDRLDQPLHWRKPRRVFVNSMSDLFHEDVPDLFIAQVFEVMRNAYWHTYQILTKRPQRMLEWCASRNAGNWPVWLCPYPAPHIWLGVSVEDQATADERIPLLLQTPAAVRFVSAEPLLDPVSLNAISVPERCVRHDGRWTLMWDALSGFRATSPYSGTDNNPRLDWVIVGGESGPKARRFDIQWARDIVQQCKAAGVPVFMKQVGANVRVPRSDCIQFAGKGSWRADSPGAEYGTAKPFDRAGGDPIEWPEDLRIREFPRERQHDEAVA